jgi:hypothetical protein
VSIGRTSGLPPDRQLAGGPVASEFDRAATPGASQVDAGDGTAVD